MRYLRPGRQGKREMAWELKITLANGRLWFSTGSKAYAIPLALREQTGKLRKATLALIPKAVAELLKIWEPFPEGACQCAICRQKVQPVQETPMGLAEFVASGPPVNNFSIARPSTGKQVDLFPKEKQR